jgi:hypothetical protein
VIKDYMQTDWPELKEDRRVERAKESREAITCEHGNARIIDHRGRDCRVITDSVRSLSDSKPLPMTHVEHFRPMRC